MVYCTKCGRQLEPDAMFCANCGEKRATVVYPPEQRKTVYDGEIHKCPNCGTTLQSFTAVCPNCGYEISSEKASSSFNDFKNSIAEYDKVISNTPQRPKTGWKTWDNTAKFFWIIFNICTLFVPLIIYYIYPLIKTIIFPKSVPELTPVERSKAALIENYQIPNERESMVNAMLYIKSKISFLESKKFSNKTFFWINLWYKKAENLNQRSIFLLNEDKVLKSNFNDIKVIKSKIEKSIRNKVISGLLVILVLVSVFFVGNYFFKRFDLTDYFGEMTNNIKPFDSSDSDEEDEKMSYKWPSSGICSNLPVPEINDGKIIYDDETEFEIELYNVDESEFEDYINQCRDKGFTIGVEKTHIDFTAYNIDEFYIRVVFYDDDQSLTVTLEAPMLMSEIQWPENSLVKKIPKPESSVGNIYQDGSDVFIVYIDNVSDSAYEEYVDACIDAGFTKNYNRDDTKYYADNIWGNHLVVEKCMFDKMYISIRK